MSRIIQISDSHILPDGHLAYGLVDTAKGLARAVKHITAVLPEIGPVDCVIVTGDLTDFGSADEYGRFRQIMSALPLPWLAVPGNHDSREAMRLAYADQEWMPPSGPICWFRDLPDFRVIGLDSCVAGMPHGELDAQTLAFLDEALATASGRPVLVGLHHPPFQTGILPMDVQPLRSPEALITRAAAHNGEVRIVCGHVHRSVARVVDGLFCQIAPAPSHAVALDFRAANPNSLALEPGAVMLHEWREGGFVSHLLPICDEQERHPFDMELSLRPFKGS